MRYNNKSPEAVWPIFGIIFHHNDEIQYSKLFLIKFGVRNGNSKKVDFSHSSYSNIVI